MAIKSLAADLAETKTELKAVRAELNDLQRRPLAVQTEQKIVNQDDGTINTFGSAKNVESVSERFP